MSDVAELITSHREAVIQAMERMQDAACLGQLSYDTMLKYSYGKP